MSLEFYHLILPGHMDRMNEIMHTLHETSEDAIRALFPNGFGKHMMEWWDHELEMKRLSRKYPEVLFCLEAVGENARDLWKKYFKNGKMQDCQAKITFDPYDEEKLC